jgi:pectinesterase
MKIAHTLVVIAALVAFNHAPAAGTLTVTAVNPLDIARPAETITVPWKAIAKAIPGARLQHLAVRDSAGRSLPYQVTNIAPEAKDPKNLGVAYGVLIFQHDFAAGEKSAAFTVERLEAVAPVFPTKVFARYVPERLDDFAWETDKIAHRIYGQALAAPDLDKTGKEVLVSSGIDVWCKRVSYPIVDRWYNKGHDHYHKDEGEGMDMYAVGTSRGCGGTGIWDGRTLSVSSNYHGWKVLANGPIRAIFELTYDAWDAGGRKVAETKRFTVDAGHNLDQIESTFTVVEGAGTDLTVGIGLDKHSADANQDAKVQLTANPDASSIALWVLHKTEGSLGTAVIVPKENFAGFAEDEQNQLVLAKAVSGRPLCYLAGAGWSKAGEFTTKQAWDDYVAECAARMRAPVQVSCTSVP